MNLLLRIHNYINRYAPSENKLRQYLSRKNHTLNITSFLNEIWYDESIMCDLWIASFLATHKWEREIREKLLKKGFWKWLVEKKIIESLSQIQDWDNYKWEINAKIDSLLEKGKSKKMIELLLCEKYLYFRDEIRLLIEWKDDDASLEKEAKRYLEKYDISDFKEKMKFYAALQRKGFSYKKIWYFLDKVGEKNTTL